MAMPSNWAKATLVLGTSDRDKFWNVFYYKTDTLTGTGGFDWMAYASQLAMDINTLISGSMAAVLGADVHTRGVNVELHTNSQVYTASDATRSGPGSTDVHPDYVAAVIQKRTDTAGKSGRGRWYFGPVREDHTLEDYIQSVNIAAYQAFAATWMQDVTSGGDTWEAQLYSKKDDSLYKITSVFVEPKLGTITGRKSHSIL